MRVLASPLLGSAVTWCATAALVSACTRGPTPAPPGYHEARRSAENAHKNGPSEPSPTSPAEEKTPSSGSAGGLLWDVAPPLTARPPASSMRTAEYAAAGPAGEAILAVFYFGAGQGGSVQDNLDRWIGQFSQPDGASSRERAQVERREVGGLEVTTVELGGLLSGGMPGTEGPALADQLLLGAIAQGPEAPVFFKFVGPRATVEAARPAFETLVTSLRRGGR